MSEASEFEGLAEEEEEDEDGEDDRRDGDGNDDDEGGDAETDDEAAGGRGAEGGRQGASSSRTPRPPRRPAGKRSGGASGRAPFGRVVTVSVLDCKYDVVKKAARANGLRLIASGDDRCNLFWCVACYHTHRHNHAGTTLLHLLAGDSRGSSGRGEVAAVHGPSWVRAGICDG